MRRNVKFSLVAVLLLIAAGVITWRQGVTGGVALEGYLIGVSLD
jgi:hypothetical protein